MGRRFVSGDLAYDARGEHRGWWRPDHASDWLSVTRGDSWRECYLALLEAVFGQGGELLVLVAGRTPADVPGMQQARVREEQRMLDSLRQTVARLSARLVDLDRLLASVKTPPADLEQARALVKLDALEAGLGKVADRLRDAVADAERPLFDKQP